MKSFFIFIILILKISLYAYEPLCWKFINGKLKTLEFDLTLIKKNIAKKTDFYTNFALNNKNTKKIKYFLKKSLEFSPKESFIGEFKDTNNIMFKGMVQLWLSYYENTLKNIENAVMLFSTAYNISKNENEKLISNLWLGFSYYIKGYYYLNNQNSPYESRLYFKKAIEYLKKYKNKEYYFILSLVYTQFSNSYKYNLKISNMQENLLLAIKYMKYSDNYLKDLMIGLFYLKLAKNYYRLYYDIAIFKYYFKKAIPFLKKVIENKNNVISPEALNFLAYGYKITGNFNEASKLYNSLINEYKNSYWINSAYFEIAEIYYSSQKFKKAIYAYKKSFKNLNDKLFYIKSIFRIAKCHENLKEFDSALRYLAMIIKENYSKKYTEMAKNEIYNILKVMITPQVNDIPFGKRQKFNAILIYPNGKKVTLPPEYVKWNWEIKGNENDGHKFESIGHVAYYTGGKFSFKNVELNAYPEFDFKKLCEYLLKNQKDYKPLKMFK